MLEYRSVSYCPDEVGKNTVAKCNLHLTKSWTRVTLHAGLISIKRRFISSIFMIPTVELMACNCRLVLLIHISSRSTNTMFPIPLRTSASAAQDPTPPSPITATVADDSRDMIVSLVGVSFSEDEDCIISLLE